MIDELKVRQLAHAIAHVEGFYEPNSLPRRANNPGDIERGDVGNGMIASKTIFPTVEHGWDALYKQIRLMVDGGSRVYKGSMTLAQMAAIYSGGDENYAANLSRLLSVPETTTLNELLLDGD